MYYQMVVQNFFLGVKMKENQSPYNPFVVWFVFGGLILFQFMYGVVGVVVFSSPEEPYTDLMFPIALGVLALAISILTFLMGNFFKGDYFTRCILCWTLCESIALFGLILVYLTGNNTYLFGFILWGLALMAVHAPSKKEYDASLFHT